MDWNVIVTVRAGPGAEHRVLGALARFGRFHATVFRDVIVGRVPDVEALLGGVERAADEGRPWAAAVARVIPVEAVFPFSPETLADRLKEAVAPFVARLADGSFCVRVERRGFEGRLASAAVERAVGEHVHALAEAAGRRMQTRFDDPDFIVVAETVGEECGVALLDRALRERHRLVQVR
jgi:tRNA(Ser,Leu) C12 N-acetylase TAN1